MFAPAVRSQYCNMLSSERSPKSHPFHPFHPAESARLSSASSGSCVSGTSLPSTLTVPRKIDCKCLFVLLAVTLPDELYAIVFHILPNQLEIEPSSSYAVGPPCCWTRNAPFTPAPIVDIDLASSGEMIFWICPILAPTRFCSYCGAASSISEVCSTGNRSPSVVGIVRDVAAGVAGAGENPSCCPIAMTASSSLSAILSYKSPPAAILSSVSSERMLYMSAIISPPKL